MPLPALIKVLSLGYLLSSASILLAATSWRFLRPRINPLYRADCAFAVFGGTMLLSLLLTAYVWFGVVNHTILMTTHYFHHLMRGGWGLAITTTGTGVLAISLLLALRAWQRTRLPASQRIVVEQAGRIPVAASNAVATIALAGVWKPQLWVNPAYWQTLDAEHKRIALHHELVHLRRLDNLRKTLLGFISNLYYILPPLRRLPAAFELDCELAVDAICDRETDAPAYRALLAQSAVFVLNQRQAVTASGLTDSELRLRLTQLERGYPRPSAARWLRASLIALAVCLLSVAPSYALLLHPTPRCFLACYLGY